MDISGPETAVDHKTVRNEEGVEPRRLAASLREIESELRLLAGSTEEEFLGIGARLHDFQTRAGSITAMAMEIVALVSGAEVGDGMADLDRIVERMRFYLDNALQKSEVSAATLGHIMEKLDEVDAPLSGFRKINKVLRMLGISTRIESTRLAVGGEGFGTLANDVEQLYVQINEKAAAVNEHKKELFAAIRQAFDRVRSVASEQRAKAGAMLDKGEASLAVLGEVNARCSGVAERISSASLQISANIGSVVTSMQFHDITRQQMEHAADALAEICAKLETMDDTGDDSGAWNALAWETGQVAELQIAQLSHALGELTAAVENIVNGLHGIAGEGETISSETREMAGAADKAGGSFFVEMDAGLAGVAGVLEQSTVENRRLAEALVAMSGTVAEIAVFVDSIETIGEEIELIALNAQVKAARTGEAGAALGVLAEAIQKLAVDARGQTGAISGLLRSITDSSGGLCGEVDSETAALEGEVREMVTGLGELIGMLEGVNARLLSLLGRLDEAVASLGAEIGDVIAGIAVQRQAADEIAKTTGALADIASGLRGFAPPEGSTAITARLAGHADRYSMQSERKVHEAVTSGDAGSLLPGGFVPLSSGEPSGEFGDNVELF